MRLKEILEFDKVMQLVKPYAMSKLTYDEIDNIEPSFNADDINRKLTETEEAHDVYFKYNSRPVTEFSSVSEILEQSKIASTLQIFQIRAVLFLLKAGRIAQKSVMSCPIGDDSILKSIVNSYIVELELENSISAAVISDTELSDNASPKLKEIRRKLTAANQKLKDRLNSFTRSSQMSKFLQDNLVTLRNGRYVVPVKSECRSGVPGLIHDRSATGATIFVEPFAFVDSNNEVKALQMDESAEIERILAELTQKVGAAACNISLMQAALIRLDLIFTRLKFCMDYDCVKPKINTRGYISLLQSRHPLINKDNVVPVTIALGDNGLKILTITGPNTGGKTVSLKTVGLFCLLAYCGFYIPAKDGSELSVFDSIYADIGDEQSIVSSLSTFSAHILNISRITNSLSKNSLVLLDELGAGTDPTEGAALAIGVLKFIQNAGCCAIITTHYSELKEYAITSKGILNASMQFNEETLSPTYKLIMGLPGTSNALKIAKNLGMKDEILHAAYESLPEKKIEFEAVLSEAEDVKRRSLEELKRYEEERFAVEQLRLQLMSDKERLEGRLESINANAKAEVARLVNKSMDKVNDMIDELKEQLKERDEKTLIEAKKALKRMGQIKYDIERENFNALYENVDISKLCEGDEIIIKSLGTTGKIVKLNQSKKEASVLSGAVTVAVKFDNLAKPIAKTEKKSAKFGDAIKADYVAQSREVKVLGMTVHEAIEHIEPYIGSLAESGGGTLRIIHGKGTGALGRGIQLYLRTNKSISSYKYAGYGEGDLGVTIAQIGI